MPPSPNHHHSNTSHRKLTIISYTTSTMEVDTEPLAVSAPIKEKPDRGGGLDSDDETLRFDKDDELFDADADEQDARWVKKLHFPAAECDQDEHEKPPGNAKYANGDDNEICEEEEDETVADQPQTVSDRHNTAVGEDSVEGRHRPKNRQQQGKSSGNNKTRREGATMGLVSDAQLSCPLCFTTVCLECQRHAKYANQFRAVTAINVNVNHDEFLTLDQVSGGGAGRRGRGKRNNRGKRASAPRDSDTSKGWGTQQPPAEGDGRRPKGLEEEETFHPVCCRECDHRVGVYDTEEVFHFFGVVASG